MREGRPERPLSQCRLSHDFPWHQLRRSFPGGFYLASIGGPAAVLAEYSIKKVVVDYEDLGMEAIWKIQVEDFPAFVIINHEGRDFYTELPGDKSGGVIPLSCDGQERRLERRHSCRRMGGATFSRPVGG